MGEVLTVKVKERDANGPGSVRYKNSIDLRNPATLAILFSDLELHGANISKAFEKFKKEKLSVQSFPW